MTHLHQKHMEISKLVIQCGGLASIMESSFGPHGKAVLMDRSGSVTITQDGSELLSSLSIGDPVLNMVTRGVLDQSHMFGDGCKRILLLLRCLIRSLDRHISYNLSESLRRQSMLQVINYMRKYLLSNVQRKVFEKGVQIHPLHNFEALGEILSCSAESFFSTKFPKIISRKMTELFRSYLLNQCNSSDDALKLIENATENTKLTIIEVYNTPLLRSNVSPGFIISRDIKNVDQMCLENVSCVLWSLELEANEGSQVYTSETSDDELLIDGLMMRNSALARCLSRLKVINVHVIFSSVYFPDWAVLMCREYGIVVVDMIDANEWTFLMKNLNLIPVSYVEDINFESLCILSKIEPVSLGNSRFVRLHDFNVHQIILCGPTVSQCKQFSSAFSKLFRYLHHWIMDSLCLFGYLSEEQNVGANICSRNPSESNSLSMEDSYYLTTVNSLSDESNVLSDINSYIKSGNPLPLFYSVPPGEYSGLLAKYFVLEDQMELLKGRSKVEQSVIEELLDEIPTLLFKKSKLPLDRFVTYNTKFNCLSKKLVDDSDCYSLSNLKDDFKLYGYESPFIFFKILDTVFTFAQLILKVDRIIPSRMRINQNTNSDIEDSDDEIF